MTTQADAPGAMAETAKRTSAAPVPQVKLPIRTSPRERTCRRPGDYNSRSWAGSSLFLTVPVEPNPYVGAAGVRDVTSRLPGFHKLTAAERRALLAKHAGLSRADLDALEGRLPDDVRDRLVENAVGAMPIPLGIATNFVVNGREVLVPMAVEESSVVAAAS